MSTSLRTLIGKLHDVCRQSLDRSANHCVARGHYQIEIEHLLLALLDRSDTDLGIVVAASGIPLQGLRDELERELAKLQTGNLRTPVFSRSIIAMLEKSWLIASIDTENGSIRSAHLLLALLSDPELRQQALRVAPLLDRLPVDQLKHHLDRVTQGSIEAASLGTGSEPVESGATGLEATPKPSRTPALDQFTMPLTKMAREGRLDPVIGREAEIRQVIDILLRRRQNNPILTGEAGVGKTAVVEGLALRIASGDVPPALTNVEIHSLDMGLLQAGASVKGEFEQRLKSVMAEVSASAVPIVLFIDETHTIVGAGGTAGQNDAANLLKPALARGELRTIGATTWAEYKLYFEKDAALTRRFQVVKVDEPDDEKAIAMVRGVCGPIAQHFDLRVLNDAVEAAVTLSRRYLTGRQLPDKAISVLDTACARVALAQSATPGPVEDLRMRIQRIDDEMAALDREDAGGTLWLSRRNALRIEAQRLRDELTLLEARWQRERELVAAIRRLRRQLDEPRASVAEDHAFMAASSGRMPGIADTAVNSRSLRDIRLELEGLIVALDETQAGKALVPAEVDAQVIAEVISAWTGIPLGRVLKDEIRSVRSLDTQLGQRIVGQDHALKTIAGRIQMARAGLEDPTRPQGVFLLVGPSGVGKTETALSLAETLYGGERQLVTINMSEYQEAHSVAGLKGAPPGYVGFGSGGVLTEAVRRNPYCTILLDEIEKAHPDVLELFYQVFDKGRLDDSEGRTVDFRNTVILLTSNVGSATMVRACLDSAAEQRPQPSALLDLVKPALYQAFKPAFLGRCTVIPYYPIDDETLLRIIELKLDLIGQRVRKQHDAEFRYSEGLVEAVLSRCTEVDSGARSVDHILNANLLPQLADQVLEKMSEGEAVSLVEAEVDEGSGQFVCRLS